MVRRKVMQTIKLFYDLETTGVDHRKHSPHQIAGLIEVNDEIVETFDIKVGPHPKAKIEPEALKVAGITLDQVKAYPPFDHGYRDLTRLLGKYIDKYNSKQKAWLIGYNNRAFDDLFLRMFFELNNDPYIGSWFWADTIDVLVLASEYLINRRSNMPSFKQGRVAQELGIAVEKDRLHDALYDVILTREIYKIVTNREIEL